MDRKRGFRIVIRSLVRARDVPRLDRSLLTALLLGAAVRIVPIEVWWRRPCIRDECTYRDLAGSIARGDGMVGTKGWLWAPGYPSVIAAHASLFGRLNTVKYTQVAVALLTIWLLWRFTRAHFGPRAATIAAFLLALSPTHAFYASSLWSECFYTAILFGMVSAIGWARGEPPGGLEAAPTAAPTPNSSGGDQEAAPAVGPNRVPALLRAAAVGILLGACVLFRGVATYLLPLVAITLVWGRWRSGAAWRSVVAMGLAAALTVAPYSVYATQKFGALIVSDRTLGQMLWLGDNDYPPVSFDFGNGPIDEDEFDAMTSSGRPHCPFEDDAIAQDACETRAGIQWIKDHPVEFVERMPLRVAQLLNPHSLLTRNLRTGHWKGLPNWVDQALVLAVVASSFVVLLGGTLGLFARGRGWYAVGSALIVTYHVAAIACLAGLSRYRVPLEPLWMVYAAGFLADPKAALAALRADPRRGWGAVLVGAILLGLMMWFLPTGWRSWKTW